MCWNSRVSGWTATMDPRGRLSAMLRLSFSRSTPVHVRGVTGGALCGSRVPVRDWIPPVTVEEDEDGGLPREVELRTCEACLEAVRLCIGLP
jgi:hypothetical protein